MAYRSAFLTLDELKRERMREMAEKMGAASVAPFKALASVDEHKRARLLEDEERARKASEEKRRTDEATRKAELHPHDVEKAKLDNAKTGGEIEKSDAEVDKDVAAEIAKQLDEKANKVLQGTDLLAPPTMGPPQNAPLFNPLKSDDAATEEKVVPTLTFQEFKSQVRASPRFKGKLSDDELRGIYEDTFRTRRQKERDEAQQDGKQKRPAPQAMQKALSMSNAAEIKIRRLLTALSVMRSKGKSITGVFDGRVHDWISAPLGLADPEIVAFHSALKDLVQDVAIEKSGLTVTDRQMEFIKGIIGNGNVDEGTLAATLGASLQATQISKEHALSLLETGGNYYVPLMPDVESSAERYALPTGDEPVTPGAPPPKGGAQPRSPQVDVKGIARKLLDRGQIQPPPKMDKATVGAWVQHKLKPQLEELYPKLSPKQQRELALEILRGLQAGGTQ